MKPYAAPTAYPGSSYINNRPFKLANIIADLWYKELMNYREPVLIHESRVSSVDRRREYFFRCIQLGEGPLTKAFFEKWGLTSARGRLLTQITRRERVPFDAAEIILVIQFYHDIAETLDKEGYRSKVNKEYFLEHRRKYLEAQQKAYLANKSF